LMGEAAAAVSLPDRSTADLDGAPRHRIIPPFRRRGRRGWRRWGGRRGGGRRTSGSAWSTSGRSSRSSTRSLPEGAVRAGGGGGCGWGERGGDRWGGLGEWWDRAGVQPPGAAPDEEGVGGAGPHGGVDAAAGRGPPPPRGGPGHREAPQGGPPHGMMRVHGIWGGDEGRGVGGTFKPPNGHIYRRGRTSYRR